MNQSFNVNGNIIVQKFSIHSVKHRLSHNVESDSNSDTENNYSNRFKKNYGDRVQEP